MKVNDLAKEFKLATKIFIEQLKEVEINVKSGESELDKETTQLIREVFADPDNLNKNKKNEEIKDYEIDLDTMIFNL